MKAAVYTAYGPPEVVRVTELEKPAPKDNEVLVKVIASTVNRTDSGFRSAEYVISRFWSGLFRPKHQILGSEFAGIIEATGPQVQQFKIGDRVFGYNDITFGGHGTYLCIAETSTLAEIPDHIDFQTAAAITEGAHYALVDIRAAKVKPGQNVLVYGASGAIGSAAVQLLKHFGAVVTAVCNTKNTDLLTALGADVVIDYQTSDFTKTNQQYDFIFDAVGKSSYRQCKPLLTKKGIYISTELGKNGVNILLALTTPLLGGKRLLFPMPSITREDVLLLRDLVQTGAFKPVIDKQYTLDQIVEAYKYVETGQKTGNVILNME